jgi:TPP-dependent pyruvate/acetoin dehydrogenase alpha subunit
MSGETTTEQARGDGQEPRRRDELPPKGAAREWLYGMMLIRRFEERAGEMYAKAKIGGFLHLAIGEERRSSAQCVPCATPTT